MKILITYAHPTGVGHHAYFLERLCSILSEKGVDHEVLDLYSLNFNPVLGKDEMNGVSSEDVKEFRNKISENDRLVFIFPTWWQGMPAIMKGFFDRVFSSGFAFKYENGLPVGLLKGKRAAVFSATGGPKIINDWLLRRKGMRIVVGDILSFCGVKAKGFSIGSARKLNEKSKNKINKVVNNLYEYISK